MRTTRIVPEIFVKIFVLHSKNKKDNHVYQCERGLIQLAKNISRKPNQFTMQF